jgi:general L-amino acid transport system substrate-binding protein
MLVVSSEGNLGGMLGLDKSWAKRAIKARGNYAEIFESNLGMSTPVALARGMNAHYKNGGMQYNPPFR